MPDLENWIGDIISFIVPISQQADLENKSNESRLQAWQKCNLWIWVIISLWSKRFLLLSLYNMSTIYIYGIFLKLFIVELYLKSVLKFINIDLERLDIKATPKNICIYFQHHTE